MNHIADEMSDAQY